jgi:hypothetical protein
VTAIQHGTYNAYRNRGCRCDACRTAHTDYCRTHQKAGYERVPCACGKTKRPDAVKCRACRNAEVAADHGTESKYSAGCRCDECREAATAAKRRRREAARVPCSNGCGRMVEGINRRSAVKAPLCRVCANERTAIARRKQAA